MIRINPFTPIYFGHKRKSQEIPQGQLGFDIKDDVVQFSCYESLYQKATRCFGDNWHYLTPRVKNYLINKDHKENREKILDEVINYNSDNFVYSPDRIKEQKVISQKIFNDKAKGEIENKWGILTHNSDSLRLKRSVLVENALKQDGKDVEDVLIALLKCLEPKDSLKVDIINGLGKRHIPEDSKDRKVRRESIAKALSDELLKKDSENKYSNNLFLSTLIVGALENFNHDYVTTALLKRYKDCNMNVGENSAKSPLGIYITQVLDTRLENLYKTIEAKESKRHKNKLIKN